VQGVPLIYNPRAGGGRGERRMEAARVRLKAHGIAARPVPTIAPGDGARLAEELARQGAPRILVVGGDGTCSEVADGILRSGRPVELGPIPGGTGNDFLASLGVVGLEDAAARIAKGEPRALDAGRVAWEAGQSRHFVGVFGVGFMAKVCDLANRRFKWAGARSYSLAVFPEVARLASPATRLSLDGRAEDGPYALVAVCNVARTGGGMRIAPDAAPDDGLLDVIALRQVGRARLLRLFPMIFEGRHVGQPEVLVARARRIEIAPAEPSPLLGDGEAYGRTPCAVEALPGALHVLV
jgi:diacylglycerol kinase (ATP)